MRGSSRTGSPAAVSQSRTASTGAQGWVVLFVMLNPFPLPGRRCCIEEALSLMLLWPQRGVP